MAKAIDHKKVLDDRLKELELDFILADHWHEMHQFLLEGKCVTIITTDTGISVYYG